MTSQPANPGAGTALWGAIDAVFPARPEAIETEVVELFDEFRGRLLRYVLSLGLCAQDGEDIIQEVFLSLFRHLCLGRSRENLRGWIFCVAHNLALKQRNRNKRHQQRSAFEELALERHLDPAADPEEQLATSERQKRLLSVVNSLAETDRWCLYLRAEGLRYREIARALEMSLGAVANSLARSMQKLACADER
jgi:RNA polymerase sigma-70 factor, ECF subfamily